MVANSKTRTIFKVGLGEVEVYKKDGMRKGVTLAGFPQIAIKAGLDVHYVHVRAITRDTCKALASKVIAHLEQFGEVTVLPNRLGSHMYDAVYGQLQRDTYTPKGMDVRVFSYAPQVGVMINFTVTAVGEYLRSNNTTDYIRILMAEDRNCSGYVTHTPLLLNGAGADAYLKVSDYVGGSFLKLVDEAIQRGFPQINIFYGYTGVSIADDAPMVDIATYGNIRGAVKKPSDKKSNNSKKVENAAPGSKKKPVVDKSKKPDLGVQKKSSAKSADGGKKQRQQPNRSVGEAALTETTRSIINSCPRSKDERSSSTTNEQAIGHAECSPMIDEAEVVDPCSVG